MLNLIFDTKFYDLGFWGSEIYTEVCPMVRSYKNNFVSLIESMQKKRSSSTKRSRNIIPLTEKTDRNKTERSKK